MDISARHLLCKPLLHPVYFWHFNGGSKARAGGIRFIGVADSVCSDWELADTVTDSF
jgi:hypothetical protein